MYTRDLVKAMLVAADRLEAAQDGDGPNDYQWSDTCRCNCGFLAQVALEVTSIGLRDLLSPDGAHLGSWTSNSQKLCPATGLPMNKVYRVLAKMGMKVKDYRKLERLDDMALCYRARVKYPDDANHFAKKKNVAKYLRVWAKEITQKLDERAAKKAQKLVASVRKEVAKPLPTIRGTIAVAQTATKSRSKKCTLAS